MKKGITVYTEYDRLGRWTLVIEKEKGIFLQTKRFHYFNDALDLVVGGFFHADLYPAAAALQGEPYALEFAVAAVVMGNELYHRPLTSAGCFDYYHPGAFFQSAGVPVRTGDHLA